MHLAHWSTNLISNQTTSPKSKEAKCSLKILIKISHHFHNFFQLVLHQSNKPLNTCLNNKLSLGHQVGLQKLILTANASSTKTQMSLWRAYSSTLLKTQDLKRESSLFQSHSHSTRLLSTEHLCLRVATILACHSLATHPLGWRAAWWRMQRRSSKSSQNSNKLARQDRSQHRCSNLPLQNWIRTICVRNTLAMTRSSVSVSSSTRIKTIRLIPWERLTKVLLILLSIWAVQLKTISTSPCHLSSQVLVITIHA